MFKIFGKKTETKVEVEPEIPASERKLSPYPFISDIEWFRASQVIGKWVKEKKLKEQQKQKELVKNEN